jgi:hypothetical protein
MGVSVSFWKARRRHRGLTYHSSEILPLRLRQRGSAISTAANWICNYVSISKLCARCRCSRIHNNAQQIIVQITPPAINNIGWRTYIIFAVLNALWVPIIFFFFPETKGLELEEVDRLFSGETSYADVLEKGEKEVRVEKIN